MTNNQIIPITAGVREPKRRRVGVRAGNGPKGIEIHAEILPYPAALAWELSREPGPVTALEEAPQFRGCTEKSGGDRTYWIGSDFSVRVRTAGQPTPTDVVLSFSTVEELTAAMSDWRMPQLVRVWNQLPGARRITRFENRTIAVERLWQAIAELPQQAPDAKGKQRKGERKSPAGPSKTERLIGLLRTPGGVTLQALMEASGWQAHSVRGFLSGKLGKQLGLPVTFLRRDGQRVYALAPAVMPPEQPEEPE